MAVERDVGRIQIEHDLVRSACGVRLDEHVHQQRVDLLRRVVDLVIALAAAGKFQPVQRALARQGCFQLAPARQHPHQRIVAQLLMIVEVLIAQRQPVDALRQHLRKLVLDKHRRAPVGETRRHPLQQTDLAIGLPQQQRTAIARHLPGCETGLYPARKMCCKREDFLITLCHEKGRPFLGHNTLRQRSYDTEKTAFPVIFWLPDTPHSTAACEICRLAP